MRDGFKGQVVKVDPFNLSPEVFFRAVQIIESGGIVAFPTDTFYGLGADPFNIAVIERLRQVKGRDVMKPISLVIDDAKHLKGLAAGISPQAASLIRKFWPGPLTILFQCSVQLPAALIGAAGKIGIRIPNHPVALRLLQALGRPLTATSANCSGKTNAATAEAVGEALGSSIDLILDGGVTPGGLESTIVDATLFPPRLIREGQVPFREVLEGIGLGLTEDHSW